MPVTRRLDDARGRGHRDRRTVTLWLELEAAATVTVLRLPGQGRRRGCLRVRLPECRKLARQGKSPS